MPAAVPTTLLAHHAPAGFHYDWLIAPPPGRDAAGHPRPATAPAAADPPPLWTARVVRPWSAWRPGERFVAVALPPHRRRYLHWSGTLSGHRGHVHPAARATVRVHRWTPAALTLHLHVGDAPVRLDLRRPTPTAPLWTVWVT